MYTQEKAIRRFHRHLALLLVVKYTLPLATLWGFVWGTAVLALRASTDLERKPLLWGLAGLLPCLAIAVVRAWRHMPAPMVIRALLDQQSGCGGLLMAASEQELNGWREKMPHLKLPRVRWDANRPLALLATAALFVLLGFLAPQGLADISSQSPLEIDQEIARLTMQVTLLGDESILQSERAETLKEKLAQLHDNASGKDPARTLEALDYVRQLAQKKARQATEERTRRGERLSEAEALTEMLHKNADLLGPRTKTETLMELAGLLEISGVDLPRLAQQFSGEFTNSLRQQKIDPEQLSKLAKVLRDSKVDLVREVEKLHKAGLIDAEVLKRFDAPAPDNESLQAFLREKKGKTSLADIKGMIKKSGDGGRGPGSGAAEPTWSKAGKEEGLKFKEEVLPATAVDARRSSALPERPGKTVVRQTSLYPSTSGALNQAAAGSGSANTDVILPRHRAAVERYFERQNRSEK